MTGSIKILQKEGLSVLASKDFGGFHMQALLDIPTIHHVPPTIKAIEGWTQEQFTEKETKTLENALYGYFQRGGI